MNRNGMSAGRASLQKGVLDKPKMKTSLILKRLWKYLYKFKWMLLLAAVLSLGSNLLALVGPELSGQAVDAIHDIHDVDFETVFACCGLMLLCYAFSSAFEWLLSVVLTKLSQRVVFQMRKDVFDRLTTLPVSFFDTHQTGDILSHISYDIDTVNTSLSNDLMQICCQRHHGGGRRFIMMLADLRRCWCWCLSSRCRSPILFTRYTHPARCARCSASGSSSWGRSNGFVEEIDLRPEDHQGLPPGGDDEPPLRCKRMSPAATPTTRRTTLPPGWARRSTSSTTSRWR